MAYTFITEPSAGDELYSDVAVYQHGHKLGYLSHRQNGVEVLPHIAPTTKVMTAAANLIIHDFERQVAHSPLHAPGRGPVEDLASHPRHRGVHRSML